MMEREPEQLAEPPKPRPGVIALHAILLSEPLPDQLLIRLRFAEGLTHAQIAQRLNVTAAASRKRLERVLERLRHRAAEDPELKGLLKGEVDEQS